MEKMARADGRRAWYWEIIPDRRKQKNSWRMSKLGG